MVSFNGLLWHASDTFLIGDRRDTNPRDNRRKVKKLQYMSSTKVNIRVQFYTTKPHTENNSTPADCNSKSVNSACVHVCVSTSLPPLNDVDSQFLTIYFRKECLTFQRQAPKTKFQTLANSNLEERSYLLWKIERSKPIFKEKCVQISPCKNIKSNAVLHAEYINIYILLFLDLIFCFIVSFSSRYNDFENTKVFSVNSAVI